MASYVVEQILKAKKITDYLASKGVHPKGGEVNGKLRYCCPLHEADKTPSFIVYINGDFQNFYCYGCKAKYHIIHLYRELEKVSTGDAIKALSGDLDLSIDSEITHAINEIENDRSLNAEYTPPQLALIVGRQLYDFMQRVEKDPQYVACIDKMEEVIDKALEKGDIETLKTLYESLPDTLMKAIRQYDEKKEKGIMDAARSVNGYT